MIDPLKPFIIGNKGFCAFLEKDLNIKPNNPDLYELAFLHKSASVILQNGTVVNNERLEFLGDAIIDAIVSDYVFHRFPDKREGFMTQMRSKIVNRSHLDSIASKMGLCDLLITKENSTNKKRICGDAFEALVGAIYLDLGYEKTQKFIVENVLEKYIDLDGLSQTETDCKSRIMEWGQKNRLRVAFMEIKGPVNAGFTMQISIGSIPIASGNGYSKKEAEQVAARKALDFLFNSGEFSMDTLQYLEQKKEKQG
ncbi:MAG: ribonuclease III [Bacteroidales bacterium]|jgi:ribonuclease-3|nr:ribonuclease III [Bacteroidales bacterium]